MSALRVGFAMCGSFCTFVQVMRQMRAVAEAGYEVTPIMSETAYKTDTRFGRAEDFIMEAEEITGNPVIHTIYQAEPIGPKKLLDALVVAPCTGNTLGKLANGITDTAVTMAVKAHLRNGRPVLLAVSTNDALGASAKNIGQLMQCRNVYFVPMSQDDPEKKPASVVAHFEEILPALAQALEGKQIQPVYAAREQP